MTHPGGVGWRLGLGRDSGPMKWCKACGKRLERRHTADGRYTESITNYEEREHCDRRCWSVTRERQPRMRGQWPAGMRFEDAEVPDGFVCRIDKPSAYEVWRNAATLRGFLP